MNVSQASSDFAQIPTGHGRSPVRVDVVPGRLAVSVHRHEMVSRDGRLSCWTYVTEGFGACGQREIVFTLRRVLGEEGMRFPTDPVRFFEALFQLAAAGSPLESGGFTEFGPAGFLGRADLRAMAYMAPQALDGIPLPPAARTAILLTADEVEVVKSFGLSRVLALLGQAVAHFPCPPWSDRRRPSVVHAQGMQGSGLEQLPRLYVRGMVVSSDGRWIRVRLPLAARVEIQQALATMGPELPFALLTEIDPEADACLVWQAGQGEPTGIAAPGSEGARVAGCFLGVVPQQGQDGGQMFEDGMVVTLTAPSWQILRRALESGRPAVVPATGDGLDFLLEWLPT